MEKIRAMMVELDEQHFIKIKTEEEEINIPISEDKPKEVKGAFNKLIALIKNGEFEIEMEDIGPDLFSQVAREYIIQLNREILEVRKEMKTFGLVEKKDTGSTSEF